jgi:hypothetical protein
LGRPEGKIPLGRPRPRWEENIKLIFHNGDGDVWTGSIWLRIRAGKLMLPRFS